MKDREAERLLARANEAGAAAVKARTDCALVCWRAADAFEAAGESEIAARWRKMGDDIGYFDRSGGCTS